MAHSTHKASFSPSVSTASSPPVRDAKDAKSLRTSAATALAGAPDLQGVGTPQAVKLAPEPLRDTKGLKVRSVSVAPSDVAPRRAAPAPSAFERARSAMRGQSLSAADLVTHRSGRPAQANPLMIAQAQSLIRAASTAELSVDDFGATVSGVLQAIVEACVNMNPNHWDAVLQGMAGLGTVLASDLSSGQRMALGYTFAAHSFWLPPEAFAGDAGRDLANGMRLAQDPVAALSGHKDHSQAQADMLHCLTKVRAPKKDTVHQAIEALATRQVSSHVHSAIVDFALIQRQREVVDFEHHEQLISHLFTRDNAGFADREALAWAALKTAIAENGEGVASTLDAFAMTYARSALAVSSIEMPAKLHFARLRGPDSGNHRVPREQMTPSLRALNQQVALLEAHAREAGNRAEFGAIATVADGLRRSAKVLLDAANHLASVKGDKVLGTSSRADILSAMRALDDVIHRSRLLG